MHHGPAGTVGHTAQEFCAPILYTPYPQFSPSVMALEPVRRFMVCKYQHFDAWGIACGRRREYLIMEDTGAVGFYRLTKRGYRVLEWQGSWHSNYHDTLLEFRGFACSPAGNVNRHDLDFHYQRGVWSSLDGRDIVRRFLPLFGMQGTRSQVSQVVYALNDRFSQLL